MQKAKLCIAPLCDREIAKLKIRRIFASNGSVHIHLLVEEN